jgi:tetratricopeptide (TPR) repeat protein
VLVRAGRDALRKGAADSAVAYLSCALREPPRSAERPRLLLEVGQAEALMSLPGAVAHLREAYEALGDPELRADAAGLLGRALLFAGFPEDAVALAQRAAAELPERFVDMRERLVAFELFCALFGGGGPDALARLEPYRTRPVGDGLGAKMLAAIAAQAWMYACGPSDAVSELSLAALSGGELIAADNELLATCAITNLTYADRDEAEHLWQLARADAHRRGSLTAIAAMRLWRGRTLCWRGELADAQASLESVLDDLDKWDYGELQAQIYADAHLSAVLRERGDVAGARRALEPAGGRNPVRDAQDGRDAPRQRLPQARDQLASRACKRAGAVALARRLRSRGPIAITACGPRGPSSAATHNLWGISTG